MDPMPRFCDEPVVQHAIAVEKVRYTGEALVAVAAESRYVAEDALELIQLEGEPLPVVADASAAMEPGAPMVHENLHSSVVCDHRCPFGDAAGDCAQADLI